MKWLKAALIILLLFLITRELSAVSAVKVHFNFYQGIRQIVKVNPAVATSYYLKSIPGDRLVFKTGQTREIAKLKKIYNLKEVKQLLQVTWFWDKDESGIKFREIFLNKNEYRIILALKRDRKSFRLEIIAQQKETKKSLLATEMTIPPDNTAIYGFEGSQGNIYFLSLHRPKDQGKTNTEKYIDQVPKLIHRIEPEYPEEAVSNQVEGTVVLEVEIDKKGIVNNIKVTSGKYPILNEAAVKAVKQWIYQPYKEKGRIKNARFYVALDFYFN